jgi:hypothetical protein
MGMGSGSSRMLGNMDATSTRQRAKAPKKKVRAAAGPTVEAVYSMCACTLPALARCSADSASPNLNHPFTLLMYVIYLHYIHVL